MKQRNQSLDALRGFAILTMILSGSIAFGDTLPAWMYHAQVPPPDHKFIPTIPGITWVDLVFPFFLFSMGAAIPLSLAKLAAEKGKNIAVFIIALRRYVLLTFFALFIFHMRAWVIADNATAVDYLLSIGGFVLLFFQFYDSKHSSHKTALLVAKVVAFVIGIFLLYQLPFAGKGFQLNRSDIIIIVLGNMAFFGTLIWWFTRKNVWLRLGILPLIMAVFLGGKETGSWNETLFHFSPVPWMYTFYYLKYLFITIPGTLAGEWLLQSSNARQSEDKKRGVLNLVAGLSFILIISNTALLFNRNLLLNLVVTVLILVALYYLLNKLPVDENKLLRQFFQAGAYLLLLGLFFEAYEGGVKKDSSTYSYYFVTSGLAFFMLIGLYGLQWMAIGKHISNYLSLNGRNPMIAYVAGNLLLTPLLNLTGLISVFDGMNTNPWIGFLRGVLFTGIVSLITIFCTKRKWFWKT